MSKSRATKGLSFWVKLSLGTILLVTLSGFTALTIIQSLIEENFEELTRQQFALQMRQSEDLRNQEQEAISTELASATANPRLTAAFNLGTRSGDYSRFYNDLTEELEPILLRFQARGQGDTPFFRFIDYEGNFIQPPSTFFATFENATKYSESEISSSLLPLITSSDEQVQAQPRSGYLVLNDSSGSANLKRIFVFPTYDNLGYFMGDLMLILPNPEILENDTTFTGIWINNTLYAEQDYSQELRSTLATVLSNRIQSVDSESLEISGMLQLAFTRSLNADSRFPTAILISLYSLESQRELVSGIRKNIAQIGLITLLTVVLLAMAFSRQITRSIERLVEATRKVAVGDFTIQIPVTTQDEIGRLTQAFNEMTTDLALKERYRSVLNKVTDQSIAHSLTAGEIELGGEKRQVAVLFADIRGFTPLTETMQPDEVVQFLNEHMSALTRVAQKHGGVVDKFIGDEIMLIFGAPGPNDQAAEHAMACALDMIECRIALNKSAATPAQIGIGIATGTVLAGCIGSQDRLNYTVVGPVVNLASRLCSLASPDEIRFDTNTKNQAEIWSAHAVQEFVSVKGFSQDQCVYRLLANEGVSQLQ